MAAKRNIKKYPNPIQGEKLPKVYKLTKEERETHFLIEESTGICIADVSIKKDMTKLKNSGWEVIGITYDEDGSVRSMQFKADRKYLSFRTVKNEDDVDKPKKAKRVLSEEQLLKMQKARDAKNKKEKPKMS